MEKPYSNIAENIKRISDAIGEAAVKAGRDPAGIRLMAVTKTVPPQAVNAAIGAGCGLLGENKAQELLEKYGSYDKAGAEIHFIGHLQSNKVRQIIGKVSMIQSVDRISLAEEIDRQANKNGVVMPVLAEVNIAGEKSKSGVAPERLEELLRAAAGMKGLSVRGLMTIPPFDVPEAETERYFYAIRQLQLDIRAKKMDNINMEILSMGMSGDYPLAVKHGSTIVRVGTAIFGARNYA